MKIRAPCNVILGITTEVSYALFILAVAFLICLLFAFPR